MFGKKFKLFIVFSEISPMMPFLIPHDNNENNNNNNDIQHL